MSYDSLMFRPLAGVDPRDAVDEGAFAPLGTPEELTSRISSVLPTVQWKPSRVRAGVVTGGPTPEFLLNAEADGQVRTFTMSRATTEDVRAAAAALGLAILDMQTGDVVPA